MTTVGPVIGIETSGRQASVAIAIGGEVFERTLGETGRRHAKTLVSELRDLLSERGVRPHDAAAVGVTVGPGSFTGLRVGVACAKTLAWSCELPICGISTFDVLAAQLPSDMRDAFLVMNAERGELFVSTAQRTDEEWSRSEIEIVDERAWWTTLKEGTVVSGPLPAKSRGLAPAHVTMLDHEIGHPTAATVAAITGARLFRDEVDDAFALVPTYGRLSAAEEKAAADAKLV